jgi:hypothetical protein
MIQKELHHRIHYVYYGRLLGTGHTRLLSVTSSIDLALFDQPDRGTTFSLNVSLTPDPGFLAVGAPLHRS